jgi:hypothetical protein
LLALAKQTEGTVFTFFTSLMLSDALAKKATK